MTAPNILILMADQLAPHFTSAYGHPVVKTPNIDELAARGCRFDAAYTPSPLCAPARFSFMSGRTPFGIRAYDNAAEFPSSVPTFCHYLRQLGYHACLSGKMHFVGPDQLHGFSERLTTDIYPADYAWVPNWKAPQQRIDVWYHNMSSVHEAGSADMTYQLEYDDEVGFHGVRKIYDYAQRTEQLPFVFVASFTHPHDPYVARKKWWDMYDENQIDAPQLSMEDAPADAHSKRIIAGIQADVDPPDDQSVLNARRAYYANVTYFDDWVGQFVNALTTAKLIDNTIIFVLSDHGDMLGERGLWYKMNFFEHSARIPLIAAGPRVAQTTVETPCTSMDMLPTLLDIASEGKDNRARDERFTDGVSLYGAMTGSARDPRTAFSQYAAECAAGPIVMLRRDQYKFVYCESDPPMLFDLKADPLETQNIADKPEYADLQLSFVDFIKENWNLTEIQRDVLRTQQDRFEVHGAAADGNAVSWDYQPGRDADQVYIRSHRELDDMAVTGRFPQWSPPAG